MSLPHLREKAAKHVFSVYYNQTDDLLQAFILQDADSVKFYVKIVTKMVKVLICGTILYIQYPPAPILNSSVPAQSDAHRLPSIVHRWQCQLSGSLSLIQMAPQKFLDCSASSGHIFRGLHLKHVYPHKRQENTTTT